MTEVLIGIGALLVAFNAAASHARHHTIWRAGPAASPRFDPVFRMISVVVGLVFLAAGLVLALR